MSLKLFNQLGREEMEFKPIAPPQVGAYACGPTVYDAVHLGNWRTFIFEDLLRRTLTYSGYEVKMVMNITDVDDKIITRAGEQDLTIKELTTKHTEQFFTDRDKLNILPATVYTKATEHVAEMVNLIERLITNGLAYERDGSVYYAVAKFKAYGALSGVSLSGLKAGARVDNDEYAKEAPADFVLWKASKDGEPSWDSPWGKGRPGWHIECSAMSMQELGETFDLHLGGVDLLFPHHENEIAQSEGATGHQFVNYWLEGEHLLINNEKMSKSLGNIFTLNTLSEKGYSPLAYRYLTLTAHYRKPLNFTWESLTAAQTALNKLHSAVQDFKAGEVGEVDQTYQTKFKASLDDDLNAPQAVAVMWEVINDASLPHPTKLATLLNFDQVLGLGLAKLEVVEIPEAVKKIATEREAARDNKDFARADILRQQAVELGFIIDDTPDGPKIYQK
jgi:cysteinyl-tRNA synthetase